MSNQEQLKVGDRVMLLPIYTQSKHVMRYLTPFSFVTVYAVGKDIIGIDTIKGDILVRSQHVQPLPTKFDGWEEE